MRGRLIPVVLLAVALSACGSDSQNKPPAHGVTLNSEGAAAPSVTPRASASKKVRATKRAPLKAAPAVRGTYVTPAVKLTDSRLKGGMPAVVLLPDTGDSANADAEARKLAALGIGSYVVKGPSATPSDPAAFNQAVAVTLAAVAKLKHQPGVDPSRVGFIAEGVGAHVGAVALGRDPGAVSAAVLADIGGTVVPSPRYAPERWLAKADGVQLLFQRDQAKRAMTREELKRLMLAAPPGTLMEQYEALGTAAQKSRDAWIKQKLLAG